MRMLVATDAIGALSSRQAGELIASGWRPSTDVSVLPVGEAGGRSPGHSTPRSDRGSDCRPRTKSDSGVPDPSADVGVLVTQQMYSARLPVPILSTMAPAPRLEGDRRGCGCWWQPMP